MPNVEDNTSTAVWTHASSGSQSPDADVRAEDVVADTDDMDFGDLGPSLLIWSYFGLLVERKWTIIISIAVLVSASAVWTKLQTPIYRARATVQIELSSPKVLGKSIEQVEELGIGSHWSTREYLGTQLKIIKSRVVAERVVDALGLEVDPCFAGPPEKRLSKSEIADAILSETHAAPVGKSRLLEITFDHSSPEKARAVANALADAFLAQNIERRNEDTVAAAEWLIQQLEALQKELRDSDLALYEFEKQHGVHAVTFDDRLSVTSNQIAQLNAALSRASARRIGLESRVAELRRVSSTSPTEAHLDGIIDNPLLRVLKMQHTELLREQEGLTRRYGKSWPRVVELEVRIGEIDRVVRREISSTVGAFESRYSAAKLSESALAAALLHAKRLAIEQNRHEAAFKNLERHQKNNERLYGLVLERAREADISRALEVNNFRVLDYATPPDRPIEPRLSTNLLVGLLLGLLLGVAIGLLMEVADQKIRDGTDFALLGITLLGLLPEIEKRGGDVQSARAKGGDAASPELSRELFVHEQPHSVAAERVRALRTNILFMSPEKRLRSILVTSAGPQEGKTTVAISLGIAMAQRGADVVLVDTDLRRPRVSLLFDSPQDIGITSVIAGQATLGEALCTTTVSGLSILPCGPTPPNPSELLHADGFEKVLEELMERFDLVIFDSPPLMAVTDAVILGTCTDGVVFVTKAGSTRKGAVVEGIRVLESVGARVLGVVLDNADLSREELGDPYGYGRKRKGAGSRELASPCHDHRHRVEP